MNVKPLHPNFKMPVRGSDAAGGFDIFMPEAGVLGWATGEGSMVGLGFAAEVPPGHVALLLPRSGVGAKEGLALNNTCGVIDADYRGEWKACLRMRNEQVFRWEAGERLLQFIIVPVASPVLNLVDDLDSSSRGEGGFGSSGKGEVA